MSKFYVIYDNMYEEYQQPFVLKNDNVALAEFNTFKQNLIEKAKDEKEKAKARIRFYLCRYDEIKYDQESGIIETSDHKIIKPEIITTTEEE